MVVLVVAAGDAQPVLLVLDVAPEQVVERPQRIDLEVAQRIVVLRPADVLETPRDRVQRLHQHSLLVPVRPDQLEQAGIGELVPEDAEAVRRQAVVDAREHRALEPDVAELVADQREIGQRQARRAVHRDQVLVPQAGEIDRLADAADDVVEIGRLELEAGQGDAAVHHHEGFGSDLQQAIGLGVGERKEALLAQLVEAADLGREAFRLEIGGPADRLAAQHVVHEPEVVVEGQRLPALADHHPQTEILGRFGRRAPHGDADVPGDALRVGLDRRGRLVGYLGAALEGGLDPRDATGAAQVDVVVALHLLRDDFLLVVRQDGADRRLQDRRQLGAVGEIALPGQARLDGAALLGIDMVAPLRVATDGAQRQGEADGDLHPDMRGLWKLDRARPGLMAEGEGLDPVGARRQLRARPSIRPGAALPDLFAGCVVEDRDRSVGNMTAIAHRAGKRPGLRRRALPSGHSVANQDGELGLVRFVVGAHVGLLNELLSVRHVAAMLRSRSALASPPARRPTMHRACCATPSA